MFKEYLIQKLAANYEHRLIIIDLEHVQSRYDFLKVLAELNYEIISYEDATTFRYVYCTQIQASQKPIAVYVNLDQYIPYDILTQFYRISMSLNFLFPHLNLNISNIKNIDLRLIYAVYRHFNGNIMIQEKTPTYLYEQMYNPEITHSYVQEIIQDLHQCIAKPQLNYSDWIEIAVLKTKAEVMAVKSNIAVDFTFIDEMFEQYILHEYSTLSSVVNRESPIIVTKVLPYISKGLGKIALIVLDGMSVFDFQVMVPHIEQFSFQEKYIYAMIPTTTAISRQSLLSAKFPSELEKPFELSREEKEFYAAASNLGYLEHQTLLSRGYEFNNKTHIRFLAIILNDIDDLVHGQIQGKIGMYNDVTVLAKSRKIQKLIKKLVKEGFQVYMTSDHGNTSCVGIGSLRNPGVAVETRSKRMLVLKNFADEEMLMQKYQLINYPGYYLDKQFKYRFCRTGQSFENKDVELMSHGGISIDEVIVPFIKIEAVYNG